MALRITSLLGVLVFSACTATTDSGSRPGPGPGDGPSGGGDSPGGDGAGPGGDPNTFADLDIGNPLEPGNPGAGDVTFLVDATSGRQIISPWIYGLNGWDGVDPPNVTLSRSGGNRLTHYNWENNSSNAGSDWYWENDEALCPSGDCGTPGSTATTHIAAAHAAGAAALFTVPITGWVATDVYGSVCDVFGALYDGQGNYLGEGVIIGEGERAQEYWMRGELDCPNADYMDTYFVASHAKKPTALSLNPSLVDDAVYQDELAFTVRKTFPGSFPEVEPGAAAEPPIFVSLDNEPGLWHETHGPAACPGDLGVCADNPHTYDLMVQRTVDYAEAVKDVLGDGTLVFAPVLYGYTDYESLQFSPDWPTKGQFLAYWLDAVADAEASGGRPLVDVLDLHFYTETPSNDDHERLQAPRSLWDSTWIEDSWIAHDYLGDAAIALIPRLRALLPPTKTDMKLAFTEYNYGRGADVVGALAQADALGVFGREGLFAATLWRLAENESFIDAAFRLYRDFDGAGAAFANIGVDVDNPNLDDYSVYAADDGSATRLTLVAINKSQSPRTARLLVRHPQVFNTARPFQITSASANVVALTPLTLPVTNAWTYPLPPRSVTLFELVP